MLPQHKVQIVEALKQYLIEHPDLSQNKVKELIGISAAYVSALVNGTWDAVASGKGKTVPISDAIFRKVRFFLGITGEVFDTRNYTDIMFALAQAKKNVGYGIIDGNTGAGKTFTITEFQRLYPTATYVLKCSNSMTARMMVLEMARVVGVGEHGDNNAIIRNVAEKLKRESNAILILDETETMLRKRLAIGFMKDLYDQVEGRAAIVLTGANGLVDQMKLRASRNIESFPQVLRRFGAKPLFLSAGIDMDDAMKICAAYGVEERKAVAQLVAHCGDYGTLFNTLQKGKEDSQALS
jgi:DNA transposition AAA+ family ATPase